MKSLSELLGDAIAEKQVKADTAGGGGGTWENLPETREYRVKVLEAKVGQLPSGVPLLDLTLSVVDPDGEYDGRRIWNSWFHSDYDFQLEQIAELYVALGLTARDLPASDDYAVIFSAIVPIIVDRTMILATRNVTGNDGVSRSKVRWVNPDNGRPLRLNIKPQKKKGAAPDLAVDVSSLINPEPFPAQAPAPAPAPAPAQPGVPQPSGIRLPTGLPSGRQ